MRPMQLLTASLRSSRPSLADVGSVIGDRAKDAILWPDPSRNGRKLAEIADLRPGASAAKSQQTSQTQGWRAHRTQEVAGSSPASSISRTQ